MSDLMPLDLLRGWGWYIRCVLEIGSIFIQFFSHMYLSLL